MTIDNLEIRTSSFKKSPARKKDGLHQIKIRVFIGKLEFGKFRNQKTLEIKVLDDAEQPRAKVSSLFEGIDCLPCADKRILRYSERILCIPEIRKRKTVRLFLVPFNQYAVRTGITGTALLYEHVFGLYIHSFLSTNKNKYIQN